MEQENNEDDGMVNSQTYAEHQNTSLVTVMDWVKNGVITPPAVTWKQRGTRKWYRFNIKLADEQVDYYQETGNKKLQVDAKTQEEADNEGIMGASKADLMKKHYEAELAKLKYEREAGKLVDLDKVRAGLYEIGKEVRAMFEGLADRCIDSVRAAQTRNEAREILFNEIQKNLRAIANLGDREIINEHS